MKIFSHPPSKTALALLFPFLSLLRSAPRPAAPPIAGDLCERSLCRNRSFGFNVNLPFGAARASKAAQKGGVEAGAEKEGGSPRERKHIFDSDDAIFPRNPFTKDDTCVIFDFDDTIFPTGHEDSLPPEHRPIVDLALELYSNTHDSDVELVFRPASFYQHSASGVCEGAAVGERGVDRMHEHRNAELDSICAEGQVFDMLFLLFARETRRRRSSPRPNTRPDQPPWLAPPVG